MHWFNINQEEIPKKKRSTRRSQKLEPEAAEVPVDTIRRHPKYNMKQVHGQNTIVCRANEDVDFTAGYVISSHPDGKVRVRCLDGLVRRFWPHEVLKLIKSKSSVISGLPSNKEMAP